MIKHHLIFAAICGVVGTAFAADFPSYPTASLVHGEKGNRSGIYIDCEPNFQAATQVINCTFFQMRLAFSASAAEMESQIKEQIDEASAMADDELMEGAQELCNVYRENRVEVDKAFGEFQTQASKDYADETISAMIDSCDIVTPVAARELTLRMTKLNLERAAATCKVWPHTWHEQFEYQQSEDGGYWVARDGPNGECGVILVSTLKHHEDYSIFWNHESQKIITNIEGDGLLLSCAELDEERVLHTWKGVEQEVRCDVFQFGF
jgi:hypothetical protein